MPLFCESSDNKREAHLELYFNYQIVTHLESLFLSTYVIAFRNLACIFGLHKTNYSPLPWFIILSTSQEGHFSKRKAKITG